MRAPQGLASPERALVHFRELLRLRGLRLVTESGPDGAGWAWLEGAACAKTETLFELLFRYEAELVAEAEEDPLVIYARTMLMDPPPSCGCLGTGQADDDAARDAP
jgi:hypothetical protein